MASSFVEYKDKYFGLYDTSYELIMSFVYEAYIQNLKFHKYEWLKEMNDIDFIQRRGGFHGFMGFCFDTHLTNKSRIVVFDDLLNHTKGILKNLKEITYEHIQYRQQNDLYNKKAVWHKESFPLSINYYLFILELISDLINERLEEKYLEKKIHLSMLE
jgi:hypothetical protein